MAAWRAQTPPALLLRILATSVCILPCQPVRWECVRPRLMLFFHHRSPRHPHIPQSPIQPSPLPPRPQRHLSLACVSPVRILPIPGSTPPLLLSSRECPHSARPVILIFSLPALPNSSPSSLALQ